MSWYQYSFGTKNFQQLYQDIGLHDSFYIGASSSLCNANRHANIRKLVVSRTADIIELELAFQNISSFTTFASCLENWAQSATDYLCGSTSHRVGYVFCPSAETKKRGFSWLHFNKLEDLQSIDPADLYHQVNGLYNRSLSSAYTSSYYSVTGEVEQHTKYRYQSSIYGNINISLCANNTAPNNYPVNGQGAICWQTSESGAISVTVLNTRSGRQSLVSLLNSSNSYSSDNIHDFDATIIAAIATMDMTTIPFIWRPSPSQNACYDLLFSLLTLTPGTKPCGSMLQALRKIDKCDLNAPIFLPMENPCSEGNYLALPFYGTAQPLSHALYQGNILAAALLLYYGADATLTSVPDASSPLTIAFRDPNSPLRQVFANLYCRLGKRPQLAQCINKVVCNQADDGSLYSLFRLTGGKAITTKLMDIKHFSADEKWDMATLFKKAFALPDDPNGAKSRTLFFNEINEPRPKVNIQGELLQAHGKAIGFSIYYVFELPQFPDTIVLGWDRAYTAPEFRTCKIMPLLIWRQALALQIANPHKKIAILLVANHYNSYRFAELFYHYPKYRPERVTQLVNSAIKYQETSSTQCLDDGVKACVPSSDVVREQDTSNAKISCGKIIFLLLYQGLEKLDEPSPYATPVLLYVSHELCRATMQLAGSVGVDYANHIIEFTRTQNPTRQIPRVLFFKSDKELFLYDQVHLQPTLINPRGNL